MDKDTGKQRLMYIAYAAVVVCGLILAAVVSLFLNDTVSDSAATNGSGYSDEEAALVEQVYAIAAPYYEASVETSFAGKQIGRYFTDHKSGHARMVAEKSVEVGETIRQAVNSGKLGQNKSDGHVAFVADIDRKTLIGAAISHDMGMCGQGYALNELKGEDGKTLKDENGNKLYVMTDDDHYSMHPIDIAEFGDVRSSHSMNSALILLINRDNYKALGYSDEGIDKMAIECMAHSKSNSGVLDLNSQDNWKDCFDRIDSLVAAYNAEHGDSPISFDRTRFENDIHKMGIIASETLALRVGDVSRDSWPEAEAQSGEAVHIDKSTVNNHGGSIPDEVADAVITIGDNNDPVDGEKDKQVHVGEQNVRENHTILSDDGTVTHVISIYDGCLAPKCTQQAIDDHIGEFYSARDEEFTVRVEFDSFDASDADYFRESYEEFRMQAAQDYDNVSIIYPWDE